MGARGPVPKRSDQRVRRNKDDGGLEVEKLAAVGPIEIPDLDIEDPVPLEKSSLHVKPRSHAGPQAASRPEPAGFQRLRRGPALHDRKRLRPGAIMRRRLAVDVSDAHAARRGIQGASVGWRGGRGTVSARLGGWCLSL
jgi:hypothetical protein